MATRPDFTQAQRRQVKTLGVTPEQIAELARALPHIAIYGRESTSQGVVRKRLSEVADAAHALAIALKRLERANDRADGYAAALLFEAHSDRLAADWRADPMQPKYPDNPDPDALRVEVARLETIARDACVRIEGKQARSSAGSPQPVSWIDDALLRGWEKTYNAHLSDDDLRSGNPPPLPEYPFGPSERGHRAKFRKVVEICFQAAGYKNPAASAERACKVFAKHERALFADLYEWTDANPTQGQGHKKADSRSKK